jgi:hypothetical protein
VRFDPIEIMGYLAEETLVLDGARARVVLVLNVAPPADWVSELRVILPNNPCACVSEAELVGRRITILCAPVDVLAAVSELRSSVASANQMYTHKHRGLIAAQQRLDEALAKANLKQLAGWREEFSSIYSGPMTGDLMRLIVERMETYGPE